MLASMERDGAVRLWDVKTGKLLREGRSRIREAELVFTRDNRLLASGPDVQTWDISDEKQNEIQTLAQFSPMSKPSDIRPWLDSIACSPDGKTLATASQSVIGNEGWIRCPVRLWSLENDSLVREFSVFALSVDFSPDGKWLASGGEDGQVCIFEVTTGRESRAFKRHEGHVNHIAWSSDGLIASVGADGKVNIYNVGESDSSRTLDPAESRYVSIAWSSDGSCLFTGTEDGALSVWSTQTWKLLRNFKPHAREISAIAVSPAGDRLATASRDGTTLIWSVERLMSR
jgi:WD40 repeat protein